MSTPDRISLVVGGRKFEHFERYSIEADLYTAADAWSVDLANPEHRVEPGMECRLYVNGERELAGIVDRVVPSYDKRGVRVKLEGRDLMGLVVDHCCEEFLTLKNITLKSLAERLLRQVPFIDRSEIVYQENIRGRLKASRKARTSTEIFDKPQRYMQIEPGQTAFEVLNEFALSRGLMFYSLPAGTFVFGKPREGGEPVFTITNRRDGRGNNVREGVFYNDISRRYSKITVIGQQQGVDSDAMDATKTATRAVVTDNELPYYKPFVARNNNDYQSPALHARMLLERQRHDGFQLFYKVPRHSQDGRNWQINELCRVQDEIFNVDGVYLIYQRVLELTRQDGPITWLKLGPPGVVA